MEYDRENAMTLLRVQRANFFLSVGALASISITLIMAFSTSSITGFITIDEDNAIMAVPNVSSHDGVQLEDLFSFASDAIRKCLTFNYLTRQYVVRECLANYFSPSGLEAFSDQVINKLLDPAKSNGFDLSTHPSAAPIHVAGEISHIQGRAAWKVSAPFDLRIRFSSGDEMTKTWQMVIWVIREYPSVKPDGFAIHSVAMREL